MAWIISPPRRTGGAVFTWIAADGGAIYDTKADADSMENHSEREEVKAAFETGAGESVRYSNTLMQKTMYAARRLDDGTVRASPSARQLGALLLGVTRPMLAVLAAALILSAILAKHISAASSRRSTSLIWSTRWTTATPPTRSLRLF